MLKDEARKHFDVFASNTVLFKGLSYLRGGELK
jgi:hypothetical protein